MHSSDDGGRGGTVVQAMPVSTAQRRSRGRGRELADAHALTVWSLAARWCDSVPDLRDVVELVWLRVAERMDVWLEGVADEAEARDLVRTLVVQTTVEECLRHRRLVEWRKDVRHAQGA